MKRNKMRYIFLIFMFASINTCFANNKDASGESSTYKEFCKLCQIGEGEICSSATHPQRDPNSMETNSLYNRPSDRSTRPTTDDTLDEMRYLSSNPNAKLPLDMNVVLRNFSDENVKSILEELEIDPKGRAPRVALAEMLNRLGTGAIGSMCKNYCKKEYLFPIRYGTEKWMFKIEHRPGLKRCLQKHYLDPMVLGNSKAMEQIRSSHKTITLPTTSEQELDFALSLLTTLTRDNLHLWSIINYLKIFPNGTKLPFKDFWIHKYYDALKAGAAFRKLDPDGNAPMSLNPNSYGSPDALVESFSADIERTISMLLSYRDQLYSFLWFHPVKNTSLTALPQVVEMMSGIPSAKHTIDEQKAMLGVQHPQIPLTQPQHPFPPAPGVPSASPMPPQTGFTPPQQLQQQNPFINPSIRPLQQRGSDHVNPQIKYQSWNVTPPASSRFSPLQQPHFNPQQVVNTPVRLETWNEPKNMPPFFYNRTPIIMTPQPPFNTQRHANTFTMSPKLLNHPPPVFRPTFQTPQLRSVYWNKSTFPSFAPYPYNIPHSVNMPPISSQFRKATYNSLYYKTPMTPYTPSFSYYHNVSLNNPNSIHPLPIRKDKTEANRIYKYDPVELKKILEDIRSEYGSSN